MNMLKRTLAMLLVLCMLFSVMPVAALADDGIQDTAGASEDISADGNYDAALADNEPDADDPDADASKTDESETDEPVVDEPVVDEPVVDEPVVDEPVVDEPVVDEPVADEPVVDEPVVDEPVVDEPETDESKTDEIKIDEIKIDEIKTNETNAIMTLDLDVQAETYDYKYSILHLDCGRKYFTKDWIIALINEMAAAGYNQLQLAFGNDGLRFLLDDMTVTANGTTYSSANVTAGIQLGNRNYHDFGTNELTQSEMTEIITHANSKGIAIVPHVNMPGHMDAIVDAIEYVGISNAHFTGYSTSKSSLNLNNDTAVSFTKALLQKYVNYFKSQGCSFFHIGADEYGNDAYGENQMGFPNMGSTLYTKFASFVNDCAAIVEAAGMTPRAWNDGISFTYFEDSFDTDIQVTYWSSGWGSYPVAASTTLRRNGHAMINTHGDFYYILGKTDKWDNNGYTYASNWSNTSFYGEPVSDPIGSMFCIWCDYPGAESETQIAANTRLILRAMAAEMNGGDANSISTEVVSGGFNEDGTLAGGSTTETREWKTVTDETTAISVSGYELTGVTVTDATVSAIEGASKVKAWDIKPEVNDTAYTEKGTVKLPVPADWASNLVRGFYMENGSAVQVTGTYADGFYTFDMPHFSVGGLMLLDATTQFDQEIELNVGDTHEIVIKNVNYNGEYATNPTGIATVVAEHEEKEGSGSATPVTSLENGKSYYIQNEDNLYLAENGSWVDSVEMAVAWTAELMAEGLPYYYLTYNYKYLVEPNNSGVWSTGSKNDGALFEIENGQLKNSLTWDVYTATDGGGTASVNQSTITFTGVAPGTTYSTVGDTTYKIVVHGSVNITIKYQTENGAVIKTETVTVADNATTYTVSNFNYNSKFYVVEGDTTLTIDPKNTTTYTVTVTETTEDLSTVTPLTIEFWQTNGRVNAPEQSSGTSLSIAATDAYSEAGIDLLNKVPARGYKGNATVVYWRNRLLPLPGNQQTGENGDDETLNGTGFTKVRYWNGSWAVYTDNNQWLDIALADYQLIAYYMNDMALADEVGVGTADWGRKGDNSMDDQYLGRDHVSIAFQVIYEGGTKYPATTDAAALAPYTYLVDNWHPRGVGTITLSQIGDYQIWKVTAETGTHSTTYDGYTSNGGVQNLKLNSFTWDNNEMTVWEDAKNPVSEYTILNPTQNPTTQGAYANLTWDETNESILIRIYIKAVETEDSLKVVYYDEKFGAVLEEFNISVESGHNFNDNIVNVSTGNTEDPPVFTYQDDNGSTITVDGRVNATGYGIVNTIPKTQNFETNLANVAVTNNRYNKELYKYTGSVISEDGKTITHYYDINQSALSPNFVADFGLPLTFNLSDVVKEGIATVKNVSVTPTTKFGTLSYNSVNQEFTYTPTEILQTIDVLTINITFDDKNGTKTVTTNVGVTPATTVYYEESFVNWGSGWTGGSTKPTIKQNTAVIGEDTNNYGYDSIYAGNTGASNGTSATATTIGAVGTFTFTGDGIQVFANANESTGYVSVDVKNSSGKIVNLTMVDTVIKPGTTGATTGQTGSLYGLPVVSLIDLQNIPHDTYTVTITKVMDSEPVYIDGIRVFNTVENSSIFVNDLEDNPSFYELRDAVLHAIGVKEDTSVDYTTMYEQVYNEVADSTALITDESVTYPESSTIQDLLDNGPKNEIYLYAGQTLTFKVITNRVMQVGLKAPQGETAAGIYVNNDDKSQDITSSVDMFYTLANKAESSTPYTVQITNNGDKILAVTELKICDDPNATFVPFTVDEIKDMLCGDAEEDLPVEPSEPSESEPENEPTKPTKPSKPGQNKPDKPGQSNKPGQGNKPGQDNKPGQGNKPGQNNKPGENNKPGNNNTSKPSENKNHKKATLKITFVNLAGKKVDTATISKTGAVNQRCVFTPAEIFAQAPARRHVMWFFPVVVTYGDTANIVVTVI